jgi:hypothetical protein
MNRDHGLIEQGTVEVIMTVEKTVNATVGNIDVDVLDTALS